MGWLHGWRGVFKRALCLYILSLIQLLNATLSKTIVYGYSELIPWYCPSWETASFLASKEISRIVWNPKIHYHVHNSPPPIPILSYTIMSKPFQPISWRFVLVSSHIYLWFPSGPLRSDFPTKNPIRISVIPIPAVCPAHLILLNLITQLLSSKAYEAVQHAASSILTSLPPF